MSHDIYYMYLANLDLLGIGQNVFGIAREEGHMWYLLKTWNSLMLQAVNKKSPKKICISIYEKTINHKNSQKVPFGPMTLYHYCQPFIP